MVVRCGPTAHCTGYPIYGRRAILHAWRCLVFVNDGAATPCVSLTPACLCSVLWLLRFPPYGERHIHAEAAARGIDPARVIFTDVAAKPVSSAAEASSVSPTAKPKLW